MAKRQTAKELTGDRYIGIDRRVSYMLERMRANLEEQGTKVTLRKLVNTLLTQYMEGQAYSPVVVTDLVARYLSVIDTWGEELVKEKAKIEGQKQVEVIKNMEVITNTDGSKTARKTYGYLPEGCDIAEELISFPIPEGVLGLAEALHKNAPEYEFTQTTQDEVLSALKSSEAKVNA